MNTDYLEVPEENMLRREWFGVDSFLSDLKSKPTPVPTKWGSEDPNQEVSWYGTESLAEAINQGEYGWVNGLNRIKALYSDLKPVVCELADRHIMRYAESGDEADIGRFVSNEPECMVDFDVIQVPATGRIVKLVAVINQSAGMNADQVFLRGAASVALADLIERSGLRSEIWAVCPGNVSDGKNWGADFRILLKAADQPLEMDRMAFWLASPSTFRRLFFRAFEQLPLDVFKKYVGRSYQRPKNPKREAGTILVDCLQYGFGNDLTNETVPAFVQKMLDSLMEPKTV